MFGRLAHLMYRRRRAVLGVWLAILVAILLVPSVMRLLGAANWWVPAPLRAWSTRASAFAEGDGLDELALEGESAA